MPDDPTDTQAERMPGGEPEGAGLADSPRDTADGTVKPQDGPMDRPGTEAEETADDPGEPMTNEPIPVAEDGTGVATPEPEVESTRGM